MISLIILLCIGLFEFDLYSTMVENDISPKNFRFGLNFVVGQFTFNDVWGAVLKSWLMGQILWSRSSKMYTNITYVNIYLFNHLWFGYDAKHSNSFNNITWLRVDLYPCDTIH